MNRIGIILLLLLAPLGGFLSAQESQDRQIVVSQQIDWQGGVLILEVALAIEAKEFNPSSRFKVEQEIERLLPGLFMSSVVEIPFDSYRTIGEHLKEDQLLFQRLESAAVDSVSKHYSRVREDLHSNAPTANPMIARGRAR